jgi:hypothetical protein
LGLSDRRGGFSVVAADLPELVEPLGPLAQLWDPLSRHWVYALILRGPVKVDLVFDVPHQPQPPWRPGADTMLDIDAHFWDWLVWLVGKRHRGDRGLVHDELTKMYRHLLGPLGVGAGPATLEEAVADYLDARAQAEIRVRRARAAPAAAGGTAPASDTRVARRDRTSTTMKMAH